MRLVWTAIATMFTCGWVGPVGAVTIQQPRPDDRDSVAIARYLRGLGFKLSAIPVARGGYYAVIADNTGGTHRYLVPLQVRADTVRRLIDKPPEIGEYDPTALAWFSIDLRNANTTVDGLLVSWDLGAEGRAGTTVMSLVRGTLATTFQDGPETCTPAGLIDVTGDGKVEIVRYVEERGACSDVCRLTIQKHFDMPPAWVELRRWTGTGWQPAQEGVSRFYAKLADKYGQIRRWLSGAWGPDSELCRDVAWVEAGVPFERWAARAKELASRDPAGSR